MELGHRQQGLGRLLHGEGGRSDRSREASGEEANIAVLVREGDSSERLGEMWT